MDKGVLTPTTREVEELAKWAFRKAGLDTDSEISKFDFDDFCLTNPTVRTFLDYWAGASNQVVIARGELWVDPVFKPNGSSLYFSLTDAPGGMLPAANVKWLRPKMFCPGTPKLYSDGGLGNQLGDGVGALRPGQMANHWFMNALSLVGSRPSLLRSLFVWTGQEKQGRFCLRFFKVRGQKQERVFATVGLLTAHSCDHFFLHRPPWGARAHVVCLPCPVGLGGTVAERRGGRPAAVRRARPAAIRAVGRPQ